MIRGRSYRGRCRRCLLRFRRCGGLPGYDLGRSLERVRAPAVMKVSTPRVGHGPVRRDSLAFDQVDQRAWLISQGFPEKTPKEALRRAGARSPVKQCSSSRLPRRSRRLVRRSAGRDFPRPSNRPTLLSSFTAQQYFAAIKRAIDTFHKPVCLPSEPRPALIQGPTDHASSLYQRLRDR